MKGPAFMLVFLAVTSFISYSQTQKQKEMKNHKQVDTARRNTQPGQQDDKPQNTKDTAGIRNINDNINKRASM